MPEAPIRRGSVPDIVCVSVIVAVLALAFCPIFASLGLFPEVPAGDDWYKECAFNRSAREAILRDHQFPLRSRYLGGGYPLVAYPEDSSLSPLFATTLLFGETAGLKVKIFVKLLVGGLGMYYLLRVAAACPPGGALLGSLVFGLSNWFHSKTGIGHLGYTNNCFLPLMLGLLVEAARGRRCVVLPALIFAVMLVDGKYVIPVGLLFLGLWNIPELIQFRPGAVVLRPAFLQKLALAVLLGCLLSMVKIVPMGQLLRANSRTVPYEELMPNRPTAVARFYDAPHLVAALARPGSPRRATIGVGWIALCLAGLAVVLRARALARWTILLAVFVWLSMGYQAPVDLWRLLWHVPFFSSMNKPVFSTNFFILMPLCVLVASVFPERVAPGGGRPSKAARIGYAAYLCVGAVGIALLLLNAYRVNAGAFTETLRPRLKAERFFQVEGNGEHYTYHNMIQGMGTIDWNGDLLLPEHAVPYFYIDENGRWHRNEKYRGEIWVAAGEAGAEIVRYSDNTIDVEVECTRPAILVVNQNYHPGWHSSVGKVTSSGGLLAVAGLPVGGRYSVRLWYMPRLFPMGLAVSAVALGIAALVCIRRVRAHGFVACLRGVDPPADWSPVSVRVEYGRWRLRTRLLVMLVTAGGLVAGLLWAVPRLQTDYALRRAELLRCSGQREAAIEVCRDVLRRDADNRAARETIGACYFGETRWQEAAAELERAMSLGRMTPQNYGRLALAYEELGRLGDAERVWRTYLELAPQDRVARKQIRRVLQRRRKQRR